MGGIFICYRREDTAGWAGRLESDLQAGLRGVYIFRDIDDIPAGVKFDEYIAQAIGSCDVLIVVIGPQWLTARDRHGVRRLDDPDDFISLEISTCLQRDIRVIPALVGGARIPMPDELPVSIRALARRQAYELSDSRWVADCRKLIAHIAPLVRRRRTARRQLVAAVATIAVLAGGGYAMWHWSNGVSPTQSGPAGVAGADTVSAATDAGSRARIVEKEAGGSTQANTDALDVRRFVGEYDAGTVTIAVGIGEQGRLTYSMSGAQSVVLQPLGGLRFGPAGLGNGLLPDWTIEFRVDAAGEVVDLVSHQANGNPVAIRREAGRIDRRVLDSLAGTYDTGQVQVKVVIASDGTANYMVPGQPARQLVWARKLHFAVKDAAGVSVEFRRGADGRIAELVSHQLNGDLHARRAGS